MATPHQYPKENQGPAILGATITVTIAALITLITRLFVRVRISQSVSWDDYIMGFAMLLCIAGQFVIIPEVRHGAGKHLDQIPPEEFQLGIKLNYITQLLYLFAIVLVKESVGYFLLRIAVIPAYRRTITLVLQCTNLAVIWDSDAKGTCWGATTLKALGYTNTVVNIITDLIFAIIIPIPMLWKVQMNRRQKTSVIGILGLGLFATTAALVKISCLPNYGKAGDWLWDSRNITIWSVVESNIGIIAGNLSCMKPLFRSILGFKYGHGSRNYTASQHPSNPHDPGTTHKSSQTQIESLRPYGVNEAHMMTTIRANKERSSSASGLRDSEESLVGLNDPAQIFANSGGIKKTTEVYVTDSSGETESIDEGTLPGRKETQMV